MKKLLVITAMLVSSAVVNAAYNTNTRGELSGVFVYADGDYIYFKLKNQPTSHPVCNPMYFVIHESVPLERRKMMLSRLMMAKATNEMVNIGFDGQGDCSHGYIRAHRIG